MLALFAPGLAPADDAVPLKEQVESQSSLIRELQGELAQMREAQRRRDDRLRALEDERAEVPAVGPGPDAVTADWVDRRIEEFESADDSRLFISGFGTSQFVNAQRSPSTFLVSFNPIFHFRVSDRVHLSAELEFEVDKGETQSTSVGLEFSQIDILANDWLTLSAGKFLLPFNVFGPKIHPSWVNKMASRPAMYEGFGRGGIIGVLGNTGVMASGGAELPWEGGKFNYAAYATNGATLKNDPSAFPSATDRRLGLEFDNTPDDNQNKMVGGRFGFLPIPNLELGASYLRGQADVKGGGYNLLGFDGWYWWRGIEARAEYIRLARNSRAGDPNAWGLYWQLAYRLSHLVRSTEGLAGFVGQLEPVVRWSDVGNRGPMNREQFAVGLNYWLEEAVALKLTGEFNSGGISENRLIAQLAYGF